MPLLVVDYDTADSFNIGTSTFTAPITGIYYLSGCAAIKVKTEQSAVLTLKKVSPGQQSTFEAWSGRQVSFEGNAHYKDSAETCASTTSLLERGEQVQFAAHGSGELAGVVKIESEKDVEHLEENPMIGVTSFSGFYVGPVYNKD